MIAYVVSSPYQVFNSLQLQKTEYVGQIADIYILKQFVQCEALAERLRACEIFRKVILVDDFARNYSLMKRLVTRNILYKKFGKRYVKDTYEEVIFGAVDTTTFVLLKFMKKSNVGIIITKNEEGIGDYFKGLFWTASKKDRLITKIFQGVSLFEEDEVKSIRERMYVYCPEVMIEYPSLQVRKLKGAWDDKQFIDQINKIFCVDSTKIGQGKILLFDAAMTGRRDEGLEDVLRHTYSSIRKYYQEQEILVKLHPRREDNIYGNMREFMENDQNIPMEVLHLNIKDRLDQMVLIGISSTAMFTPKLLFGCEPVVVFLHKLTDNCSCFVPEYVEMIQQIIEKTYQQYCHKDRIMQPETWNELEEILEKLHIRQQR